MLTMWGAGGGQGAGDGNVVYSCNVGGGGGGGAYTNTVVPVLPGATYKVNVGVGGTGGVNIGDSGIDGSDSQFMQGDAILAFAGGGKGGGPITGMSGAPGQTDSAAQISHAHATGSFYGYATNLIPDVNHAVLGASSPGYANGGASGGGCPTGQSGGPGYVLLTY
jgi:hypothetical protein